MKTLVTGASGFVGTNLVRRLVEEGADVRVLVRKTSDTRGLDDLPVEQVLGDIRDVWAVRRAVEGCRRVYHLAAIVDVNTRVSPAIWDVNVGGTVHVAAACRRAGVERLVHTSSIAAVGHGTRERPATEETPYNLGRFRLDYLDSKREAERMLGEFVRAGLDVVIVNPGYIFGRGDLALRSGEYVRVAARGLVRFTFPGGINAVDVDDVVEGHVRAMERGRPGERYILGGENLTYDEFYRLLADVVGASPPWGRLPGGVAALVAVGGEAFTALTGISHPIHRRTLAMSRIFHFVSSEKARRELGMEFGPVRRALEKAYDWFRERGLIR